VLADKFNGSKVHLSRFVSPPGGPVRVLLRKVLRNMDPECIMRID
jgi:hypothetical protein